MRDSSIAYHATEAAYAQAEDIITDGDELHDAIDDYDKFYPAAECLARCMRNIDNACGGDKNAIDGITTALAQFKRDMVKEIVDDVIEECNDVAYEDWCREVRVT